ncbi:hypothetical protein NQ318_014470 [Aromia moschata]|uniref:Partial AB-hydrolase lipase domain-containing protein n=1 Tax=Aromia moschata TaxID=1265417 RepID=A0AAV8YLY7_9CUCU|nr:hypothetical protein NQ318_014470 [Aromia moschata]
MQVIVLVLVVFLCRNASAVYVINVDEIWKEFSANYNVSPRAIFSVEDFLNGYGYPFENHRITTEDGYILNIHRIPHGKDEQVKAENSTKPAVLLMHGLVLSSVSFFILPEISLALMLADAGYDVWLGNNRGNTWSRRHTTLDADLNATYWDFSFHEFGLYDVTAMIDHILETTGHNTLSYIGHAEGVTQFFVMASMKPEYNEKITVMLALAPPVFMQNLTNPLVQTLKNHYELFEFVFDSLNITELLPHSSDSTDFFNIVCSEDSGFQEICVIILSVCIGFDSDQIDRALLTDIFEDFPAGSSVKQWKHYLQEIKSGNTIMEKQKNLEVYNNSEPWDYDLAQVTVPTALYYGLNDWLVGLPDVERLKKALPSVILDHPIEYKLFNHLDFVFAKDVVSLLYYDLVNVLNDHNNLDPLTTKSTTSKTTSKSTDVTASPGSSDGTDLTTSVSVTTEGAATALCSSIQLLYVIVAFTIVKFVA